MRCVLAAGALLVALCTVVCAQDGELRNVSLLELGATAKGSGAPFNKDWPPNNTLLPGTGRGGTIFGGPLKGGRVDIRLVVPVDIKAIEVLPLDYNGTVQPSGIDIYVEGEFVKHADLPEQPGKAQRIALEARGQHVGILVTGDHPIRTLANGRKGPNWGGWSRLRVLSTTDVAALMATPEAYDVSGAPEFIAPTGGSVVTGEVEVAGRPRLTEGHPCTLWDKEDIEYYRRMLRTSRELQMQYAGLKRAMDKRMTLPAGIPQPKQGPDGKWLHLPALEYGGTHTQLSLDIANMATVYALSGDQKYAEFAKKLLLGYADVYDRYAPGNRPGFTHDVGRCFDQRLGDSMWLIQVARGYDLIYNLPSITPEERRHIQDDLIKASARFIAANRAHMTSPTNWSAIGSCSVLMAGVATDDEDLINLGLYGPGGSKDNVRGGVFLHFGPESIDADGMWAEGAMGYQFMALQALVMDAEVMWHHGMDLYRHRDAALKRLFDSPLEYCYPDLTTPAIHDSGHGSIIGRDSYLYEHAYRRYRDPRYLLVLNQCGMHLDAKVQQFPVSILYDRDPGEAVTPAEWSSVNFFGVGYGVLRNTDERGTVNLLMDYGPNRSHGHPDKLNVDLYALGDRLIPDPGSVWYEEPLYLDWYHTTVAHNTLSVDELEQRPCGAEQIVYGPADTMGIQRARTDEAYAGVMMDRSVFVTPDYMADVFGAFGRVPRTKDLCWHIRGEMDCDLDLRPTEFRKPVERGYSEIADPQHCVTDKAWQAAFRRDGKVARFYAAGGTSTNVIVGAGLLGLERPTTILQRREVASSVWGCAVDYSGLDAGYVRSVSAEGGLDEGYALLRVETANGTDLCFTSYRPGTWKVGGLETDARQAYVLRDGDQIRAMYLGGGTLLRVGDAALERAVPGLAYVERSATGAFVLGNPSGSASGVTVRAPWVVGLKSYELDHEGRRAGEIASRTDEPGAFAAEMKPAGRVELARPGEISVFEHRQTMLRKRQQEQEEALQRARNAALERSAQRATAAKAQPLPAGTVVVVQAEDFTGQGDGEVSLSESKRGAIGQAFLGWDGTGHWIEWTIDVPAEGYYNLTICYCTELALCERAIQVNGEVQEPLAIARVPSTGGWANGSDDWRLYTVPNPVEERPLLIRLRKGANVVRLTNLNGRGINMDYLAVTSPDVTPTREMLAAKLASTQ